MFEAEIESTKIRLSEQLLPAAGSGKVHLADILERSTLDLAYKDFFRAEIEWLLYQDRIQRCTNLPIDGSDPLFQRVFGQLEDYVRRNARFDRKHALSVLDTAVKSVLNYRLRPRITLKWFVYRGEPTKPVCEILLRMRYLSDYPYFRQGFEQWMCDRELDGTSTHIMPIFEFERLVKQLDDDYILDLSTTEFIELLEPVFTFFNDPVTPAPLQTIPIEALIVFLDDKDIQVIAQKFERLLYQDGIRAVTRDMILRVVDQVLQELEQQEQPQRAEIVQSQTEVTEMAVDKERLSIDGSEEESKDERVNDASDAESVDEPMEAGDNTVQPITTEHTDIHRDQLDSEVLFAEPEELVYAPVQLKSDDEISVALGMERATDVEAEPFPDSALDEATLAATGGISLMDQTDIEHTDEQPIGDINDEVGMYSETPADYLYAFDSESAAAHIDDQLPEEQFTGREQDQTHTDAADISGGTLEVLVSMLPTEDKVPPFATETSGHSRALMREFDIADSTSTETQSSESSSAHQQPQSVEQQLPSPEDVAMPDKSPAAEKTESLPTAYDELLETGLQQVRVTATVQRPSGTPLSALMDNDLRQSILKKLCDRDTFRMEGLLARLDAAPSVRNAFNELDRYCAEYGLDPHMKVAQELRLLLVKRFAMDEHPRY
ncbi:MAG: hypothetical protein N2663_00425 [Chlorobi bacterium]|nr:hypothetical protein [Chlorobiota bacterium]